VERLPSLVTRAQALARQAGFALTREEAGPGRPSACLPGVGRFLAVLAAGCTGPAQPSPPASGRIGELGTGAGIGAGWIASAMPADCALITAEIDEQLASAVRGLFAADPRVEVVTGDALRVLPGRGPARCRPTRRCGQPASSASSSAASPGWSGLKWCCPTCATHCWSEPERTRRIYD
jgi:predicted O-methyltransferase YrrM